MLDGPDRVIPGSGPYPVREAAVLFTDAHRQPGVSRYSGRRLLDQCRIAMDLAVESVQFFGRKQHRTRAREFEHRRALVGHVAGDPD